jgi:hypothetical protein
MRAVAKMASNISSSAALTFELVARCSVCFHLGNEICFVTSQLFDWRKMLTSDNRQLEREPLI